METGGEVRIAFGGRELSLTPLVFVVLIIAALVAVLILLRIVGLVIAILKFVNGDETAVSRYFDRNRQNRGYEALQDSLIALAAGDGKSAISKATRAERYLDKKQLTALVHAQAAEMNGQTDKAQTHFKTLLTDDKTRFVGVQGLMKQRLAEGDKTTALALAKKAYALNPAHDGTLTTLFDLQTGAKDWAGARETLQARLRTRALPRDLGKRRDAVLEVASARADDNPETALQSAQHAHTLAPSLVPAAVLTAQLLAARGDLRKAANVTRKAWAQSPHPDIAAAHAAIVPEETPEARIKRFKTLLNAAPDHPETKMLAAELYLAAEDFPAARKALGDLAETDPTTRSMAIMAAISRGMGEDEATISGFLARALSAPRGDAWMCDNCNHIHGDWEPICENCQGFDTLSWARAPQSEDARTMAAAMLPLLVGDRLKAADATVDAEPPDNGPETPADPDTENPDAESVADAMAEDAEVLARES